MNDTRRKALQELRSQIDTLKGDLEDLQAGEQDYFDNMPESFQSGEKGETAEASIDAMQQAVDSLDEAANGIEEAIG